MENLVISVDETQSSIEKLDLSKQKFYVPVC